MECEASTSGMWWLRWVGCLKIYVSLQNIGLVCRSLLQKRPIFLSILSIVATPYPTGYRRLEEAESWAQDGNPNSPAIDLVICGCRGLVRRCCFWCHLCAHIASVPWFTHFSNFFRNRMSDIRFGEIVCQCPGPISLTSNRMSQRSDLAKSGQYGCPRKTIRASSPGQQFNSCGARRPASVWIKPIRLERWGAGVEYHFQEI